MARIGRNTDKETKMEDEIVCVDVYADTIGIFTEEFLNKTNIVTLEILYKDLLRFFSEKVVDEFRTETEADDSDEELFERWLLEYVCDETEKLYRWCSKNNINVAISAIA